jgi:hypothetical protein
MVLAPDLKPEDGVMSHDGPRDAQQSSAALRSTPAKPDIAISELYPGAPQLLVNSGVRYSLGWLVERKAGRCFVLARTGFRVSVAERFPLTDEGWAQAWAALVAADPAATEAITASLAKRASRGRAVADKAALDAQTLRLIRHVTYKGGSTNAPMKKDDAYDLRFLSDRAAVYAIGSAQVILEVPYRDVESVDVSGPVPGSPVPPALSLILILGLLGALLGLQINAGTAGTIYIALAASLVGGMVGAAWTTSHSIVRLCGRDGEYFFRDDHQPPDAMRIDLSDPRRAIDKARRAHE